MEGNYEIFDYIYKGIKEKKQENKPIIIGINGIDTSGKTEFTNSLDTYLKKQKEKVQIIHIDDFHNPKKVRYSGKDEIENYFYKSFNINKLVNELLIPIKKKNYLHKKLRILNLETDKYDLEKKFLIDKDTLVILEGVFIFRKEIEPYLDYKVFIHIPFDECKKRVLKRDVPKHGKEILKKYDIKYIPTQKYYLKKYPTEKYSDIIIDNTDFNKPKVIFKELRI
ncbi:MAG: hypothetical protein FH753_03285 [Firmicutes bacterium]|nr:hypothetical protein [Bacillota bacterium]